MRQPGALPAAARWQPALAKGLLQHRLADVITDSLRAAALESLPAEPLGRWMEVMIEKGRPLTLDEARGRLRGGAFVRGHEEVLKFGIGARPAWLHSEPEAFALLGPLALVPLTFAFAIIRFGLLDIESPYADVLAAVCATLPGQSPPDRASAMAMSSVTPAVEAVGLEPYGSWAPGTRDDGSQAPRLLPLFTETELTDTPEAFR